MAKSIAAWLLILAVWGCQSTPPEPATDRPPADATPESPADLLDAAAAADGARASRLYLRAAQAFLQEDRLDDAEQALARVEPPRLRDREMARYLLARASIALARDDLERAHADLLALDESLLDDPLRALLLRADVVAARESPAAAVAQLMGRGQALADDPARAQRLSDAIWGHLSAVPALELLGHDTPPASEARGWWQLKTHMLQSLTLADQQRRLAAWRSAWSDHPAARHPPTGLDELSVAVEPLDRVALMLPLSGPLSRAGRAVRDAFIATYLSHRRDVGYDVLVYDTAAEPMASLYERALLAGASAVVGPLDKDAVAAMNDLDPEIPVLALNYLDDVLPAPNLMQLGMAIEDEAATLARWLKDDRVERLVTFHNDEDWSERAMRALDAAWPGHFESRRLDDIRTVTEGVGAAMHVSASQQRHDELQDVLGERLEFLPRARTDVDAVLALVTPLEASALVPAMRFHFAGHLPVYATSQTVRGAPPERLRPLQGFRVSELPWFLISDGSYDALDGAFGLEGSPFVSLYALGVDAFRLTDRLPLILGGRLVDLLGSTGEFTFRADGRIERRLARAVIRGGELVRATGAPGR